MADSSDSSGTTADPLAELHSLLNATHLCLSESTIIKLYSLCQRVPFKYVPTWLKHVTRESTGMFEPGTEGHQPDLHPSHKYDIVNILADNNNTADCHKVPVWFINCSREGEGESQDIQFHDGDDRGEQYESCRVECEKTHNCPFNRRVFMPWPQEAIPYLQKDGSSATVIYRDYSEVWNVCCCCLWAGKLHSCLARVEFRISPQMHIEACRSLSSPFSFHHQTSIPHASRHGLC